MLADGVAWAAKNLKPDLILDMATLTGAQSVSTGKRVAAILTNDEALEYKARDAGKASGDLVYPLVYIPEFAMPEFDSQVVCPPLSNLACAFAYLRGQY